MNIRSLYNYVTGIVKLRGSDNSIIDNLNSGTGYNALNFAMTATQYILSAVGANSTISQIAAGATFVGTVETVFNQQAASILLTSDQNGILTVKQYIDAAGTRLTNSNVYTISANVPFSRALTVNGNYFNLTFKNTGNAATTTLNINTAYGTLPPTTNFSNTPISFDEVNGVAVSARPDGFTRVAQDPTSLLFDTFESLNVTDVWTIGGSVSPTGVNGSLMAAPSTAANATSYAKSQYAFTPTSNAYLQYAALIQLEAGVVTGNQRFWGLGTYVTPSLTVPITNGVVFEIDTTTGNLLASVYSNSVRTQSTTLVRPSDGTTHRYAIYYKASKVYFELDNIIVASFSFPNPQVSALSTVIGSVNGAGVLGTGAVLNSSLIGVADTGRNSSQISDGTFPWRKVKVNSDGTLFSDSNRATYSAIISNLTIAGAATDFFTITGSATKTIKITKITIGAVATSATSLSIDILKRSTANTAGTSTAPTATPNDSNDGAATATLLAYTANPTLGTLVGGVRTLRFVAPNTSPNSGATDGAPKDVIFGINSKPVILRGTSQVLAMNLKGATVSGLTVNISIEWTEES